LFLSKLGSIIILCKFIYFHSYALVKWSTMECLFADFLFSNMFAVNFILIAIKIIVFIFYDFIFCTQKIMLLCYSTKERKIILWCLLFFTVVSIFWRASVTANKFEEKKMRCIKSHNFWHRDEQNFQLDT
jgi:hypothetical protein